MKKAILFDLDGTLTDSGEGIMNCAKLALAHYGLPIPSEAELRTFVGPPSTSPSSGSVFRRKRQRMPSKSTAAAIFPSASLKIIPTRVFRMCCKS